MRSEISGFYYRAEAEGALRFFFFVWIESMRALPERQLKIVCQFNFHNEQKRYIVQYYRLIYIMNKNENIGDWRCNFTLIKTEIVQRAPKISN